MRQKTSWLITATAALAIAAGGCKRDAGDAAARTAERTVEQTAQAGREAGKDLQDGWITTKVQAKYFATPDVKGRNVDVTTKDGVVTLTGTVDTAQARQVAVQIARATEGVHRVDDRLTVGATKLPDLARSGVPDTAPGTIADAEPSQADRPVGTAGSSQPNAWITTKIHAKYFTDGTVKARSIDVDTNNGIVTLTGTVESEAERQQAVKLAQNTQGVRRVEDRLRLTPRRGEAAGASAPVGERTHDTPGADDRSSDAGITARVQSKFFLDDVVKARNINVDSREGIVTLSGHVNNEAEHQHALAIVRSVDGVKNVQDRLQVESTAGGRPSEPGRPAPGSVAGSVDDAWVTTKIQSKFFLDDLVKAGRVEVTTQGGTVTLAGEVPSNEARARAERLARETEGVTRVQNQLLVGAGAGTIPPVANPSR